MAELTQSTFTPAELDRLQRLRVSVLAFQNEIAPLPAGEQGNIRNEQFNRLRLEANALLKLPSFDKKAPRAVTEELLAERSQKAILSRLSAIVILGVLLALLGLGLNSIFLDEIITVMACLVSTGGIVLIIGALVVLGLTSLRPRRLTNFGDLYLYGQALLFEINHALNMAIPNWTDRSPDEVPAIPSVVELALDSLDKQAADWQQKLRLLEEQRLSLGPNAPLELGINLDFAQREFNRVQHEIDRLRGRNELSAPEPPLPPVPVKPVKKAV